jgi:fluoride ion exporter CrcB/FEX
MLVFVGGGIGAAARYWLGGLLYERIGSTFPYGTLAVNLLGCILIGVLMAAMEERLLVHPSLVAITPQCLSQPSPRQSDSNGRAMRRMSFHS